MFIYLMNYFIRLLIFVSIDYDDIAFDNIKICLFSLHKFGDGA